MNNEPTDQQIIEILAKREGVADRFVLKKCGLYYRPDAKGYTDRIAEAWMVSKEIADKHVYPHDEPVTAHAAPRPDYLKSLDALAPILATLTDEEEKRLESEICRLIPLGDFLTVNTLRLKPSQLARCIAKVIGGGE